MQQNLRVLTLSFWWRMPKFRVADLTEWNKTSFKHKYRSHNSNKSAFLPWILRCCAKWASFISGSIADLEFWICQIYGFFEFFSSSPQAGELPFLLSFRFYPEKKNILWIWFCWICQTASEIIHVQKPKILKHLKREIAKNSFRNLVV